MTDTEDTILDLSQTTVAISESPQVGLAVIDMQHYSVDVEDVAAVS